MSRSMFTPQFPNPDEALRLAHESFERQGLGALWDEYGVTGAQYPAYRLGRTNTHLRILEGGGGASLRRADGTVIPTVREPVRWTVTLHIPVENGAHNLAATILFDSTRENSEWVFGNLDAPPSFIEENFLRGMPRYLASIAPLEPLDLEGWIPE